MEELKTLKDIERKDNISSYCPKGTTFIVEQDTFFIDTRDLKEMAIRWIKELDINAKKNYKYESNPELFLKEIGAINEWIKMFFNLDIELNDSVGEILNETTN
jgi:hypothetical protein